MSTSVSKEAIRAAIEKLNLAAGFDDPFYLVSSYFDKFGVDMDTWLPVFEEIQKMPKQGTQQVGTEDDEEIFVDDADLFVDDAWVAEQEDVHALYEQEQRKLRERIFSTPPEKFLKIIPFKRQLKQTAKSSRQSGARARKPARRSAAQKKAASDDGDGDGGEPPRPRPRSKQQQERQPTPHQLPKFYTYTQFAEIFGITPESLRNSVSAGRFPKPHQTIFGPRFSEEHLHFALSTRNKAVTPQKKRRSPAPPPAPRRGPGRPRIAQVSKGGAA